jgi:zinc protease
VGQETPSTVAGNELTTALYGDTPIGRYATPQSVARIALADVKKFYADFYRPNDAIVVISGDIDVSRGQALARTLLEGWKPAASLPAVTIKLPDERARRKIILVDRPEGKQSTVRMGLRAYTLHNPDKFAGSVAGQILTAGIDSRLGKYVRAQKGLAYSVHGVFQPNRQAGAFIAGTDTAIESTADAITAIFKVLNDMRAQDVTPAELAEAKTRVAGGMVMAVQTIGEQAGYRVEGILNGYPIDYYDKYPERIAQVSAEQVRAVMNKYVRDGDMTIIVVAPAAQVKQQLSGLGEVEIVPMPARRPAATTQPSPAPAALKKAA